MEWIGSIIIVPSALLFGWVIGFVQLVTPFGALYTLPLAALIVSGLLLWRYGDRRLARILLLAAPIGQTLQFISWIASRRAIPSSESVYTWASNSLSVAKAGFPIQALELPPPPMGDDYIPIAMWGGVFANHLFWFVIGAALALCIISLWRDVPKKKHLPVVIGLSLVVFIYTLALFTLWYD